MLMLINHSTAIPPCTTVLKALYDEHITLTEFLICIDTIERNIRIKKRRTEGRTASRTHHIGEPRALPSCLSYSLSGAAPRAPHTPSRQSIKHPIIEVHYGIH